MKKNKINPLTLLYVNMLFPFALMFTSSFQAILICFILASVFLIIFKEYRRLLKFIIFFGIFSSIRLVGQYYSSGYFIQFLDLINYIVLKSIPLFIVASILFYNIKTSELISSLKLIKLPNNLVLGITVGFRYFPTFRHEFKYMKQSMKMRNVGVNILKPISSLEYFFVPILFRSANVAEELSSAGLTKGIECENKRTSIYDVKISKLDVIIMVLYSILILLVILGGDKIG